MPDIAEPPVTSTPAPIAPAAPAVDPINALKLFTERMSGAKPLAQDVREEPKAEVEAKVQEEKPAAPATEPTAVKVEPKPKADKKPKGPTTEEIMERTAKLAADTAVEGVRKMQEDKPVAPANEPEAPSAIPEDEARKISILERMEKDNPGKYRGVSESYATGVKELTSYQSRWEKSNPGKEFDREDPTHDEFFAKHQVDWDEGHFKTAEINSIRDEAKAEARREVQDLERRLNAKEQRPLAQAESAAYTKFMAETVGKDYAGIVDAGGALDTAALAKLEATDPVAADVLKLAAQATQTLVTETKLLFNGAEKFNGNNPLHQKINSFILEQEKAMLALPADKQLNGTGQRFMDANSFYKLKPEQKSRHWTLSSDDIASLMAAQIAADAGQDIKLEKAKVEKFVAAYYPNRASGSTQNADNQIPNIRDSIAKEPATIERKTVSPASSPEPKMAPVGNGDDSSAISNGSPWRRRFLGQG